MTRSLLRTLLITLLLLVAAPARAQTMRDAYVHLRITYISTSDWAEFTLGDTSGIATYRLHAVEGATERIDIRDVAKSGVYQQMANAQAGNAVRLTVDYALITLGEPLVFRLERGALGSSALRIEHVARDGSTTLLLDALHNQPVASDPDRNPYAMTFDTSVLLDMQGQFDLLERPAIPKMLWAVYYLWYTSAFWSQYQYFDQPAIPYTSDDPAAVARHIAEAQGAGIDGFLASWWGPDNQIDTNFAQLLDLAAAANFQIGLYFETLGDGGVTRDPAQILEWLRYALRTYGDHRAWMKIDGKPVVVFWATDGIPLMTWADIFAQLRAEGLDAITLGMGMSVSNLYAFDGLYEYGVAGRADLAAQYNEMSDMTRAAVLLDPSPTPRPHIWMATAQPGYDERGIPGRAGLVTSRDEGAVYTESFSAAIYSRPDWIMITSWNEFPEHTYIEPTANYGDAYLRLTREWVSIWHNDDR
jgi:hypothetical protein